MKCGGGLVAEVAVRLNVVTEKQPPPVGLVAGDSPLIGELHHAPRRASEDPGCFSGGHDICPTYFTMRYRRILRFRFDRKRRKSSENGVGELPHVWAQAPGDGAVKAQHRLCEGARLVGAEDDDAVKEVHGQAPIVAAMISALVRPLGSMPWASAYARQVATGAVLRGRSEVLAGVSGAGAGSGSSGVSSSGSGTGSGAVAGVVFAVVMTVTNLLLDRKEKQ